MNHYRTAMRAAGKAYWEAMLAKHGNNVAAAAREVGVCRQTVYSHLKRYGVAYRAHKGAWDRGPDPAMPSGPRGRRDHYAAE